MDRKESIRKQNGIFGDVGMDVRIDGIQIQMEEGKKRRMRQQEWAWFFVRARARSLVRFPASESLRGGKNL